MNRERIKGRRIILYDGTCNLCSHGVQFVIRRDKHKQFHFAALQSSAAQDFLAESGQQEGDNETFYLISDNHCFSRSEAALEVLSALPGLWSFCRFVKIVPRPIRDGIYNSIAKYRYRLFGRKRCKSKAEDVYRDDRFIS